MGGGIQQAPIHEYEKLVVGSGGKLNWIPARDDDECKFCRKFFFLSFDFLHFFLSLYVAMKELKNGLGPSI